mgnify:FL=1
MLVASIARGRRWLDELTADPITNVETIAKREGCSLRKANMTLSLTFLAPDLIKAAIERRQPRGMGVVRLCDMPARMVSPIQDTGLRLSGSAIVEPVSACRSLRFRKTGFRGQRMRRRNNLLNPIGGDRVLSANAAKWGLFVCRQEISGSARVCGGGRSRRRTCLYCQIPN